MEIVDNKSYYRQCLMLYNMKNKRTDFTLIKYACPLYLQVQYSLIWRCMFYNETLITAHHGSAKEQFVLIERNTREKATHIDALYDVPWPCDGRVKAELSSLCCQRHNG